MKRYLFFLILLTILVYFNSFGNAFVWDDLNNIVNNKELAEPVNLKDIFLNYPKPPAQFYRPIPYLTLYFDQILWKDNPLGFHITNFLFHLFNASLLFYLAKRITGINSISFAASLLFAIHPAHTEAVSYISGRSDLICAFFILLSFYLYRSSLLISLFLFLLALFSKEVALIFPLAILFYDLYFLKSPLKFCLKRGLFFILAAIGYLFFRYLFTGWQYQGFTLGSLYLVPRTLLFYLRLLVLPINLHMQHSLSENDLLLQLPNFTLAIIIAGSCVLLKRIIAKNRIAIFGLGWLMLWLMPFLGLLKLNADLSEHWLYIGSFGFFLLLSRVLLRNKIALSAVVLSLAIFTMQRNYIWRDDISIYKDTLKYRPNDHRLHYNLGNAFLRRGLFKEAEKEYKFALSLKPDYDYASNNLNIAFMRYAFAEEKGEYFDNSLYQEALFNFVKDGSVDYLGLKNNPGLLDGYLKRIAELNPVTLNSFERNEKLAFYLNAYNAITLKVIIQHYPVKSIRDIPGVWEMIKFQVAGRKLTLNQIEHEILRKEFREPRIHFALVCASRGCPKLSQEPFTGKVLDEQLERLAKEFINDAAKVRLDKDKNILYLSSIFKWFKEDFGDIIGFISKYLPIDEAGFIKEIRPGIRYLNYDWSLNER